MPGTDPPKQIVLIRDRSMSIHQDRPTIDVTTSGSNGNPLPIDYEAGTLAGCLVALLEGTLTINDSAEYVGSFFVFAEVRDEGLLDSEIFRVTRTLADP